MMISAALRMAARPTFIEVRFRHAHKCAARHITAFTRSSSHHTHRSHRPISRQPLESNSQIFAQHRPTRCEASSTFRTLARNKWGRRPRTRSTSTQFTVSVDVIIEGRPLHGGLSTENLQRAVQRDAALVVKEALRHKALKNKRYKLPGEVELSLVLCDDSHIQQLNVETRGKDSATDVLSFEMDDEMDYMIRLPVKLLGDLVISLDTAKAQAEERGHSLEDELRVLLVHGITHLCGFDHEKGPEQLLEQAEEERRIMNALGWKGEGLIALVNAQLDLPANGPNGPTATLTDPHTGAAASAADSAPSSLPTAEILPIAARFRSSDVQLVALDMDGTLLNSSSKILPSSVEVIRAALAQGVKVILATGKARPGALLACSSAGLTGDGLLVSTTSPGIFLQGLAVHGTGGLQLADSHLPQDVVRRAFQYVEEHPAVSLCAFLGDSCATLKMTDDMQALHHVYYEPLSEVLPSLDALLAGPPVKKLLFMSSVATIEEEVKRKWTDQTVGEGASVMQAVSTMLEIVPQGVDKWVGLQKLMPHLGVDPETLMAVGDGSNDLTMIANAGIGVAMGNAGKQVKAAASVVVASNNDGGIAEAFERFVL